MNWKIVADSGSNWNVIEDIAPNTKYVKAPLILQIGEKNYSDDGTLDVESMIDYMYSTEEKTSSACPSPEAYKKTYEGADNIIVLTITGTMSGSYNSARIGKEMLLEENPNANVHVIDTKSAGGQMDLIVQEINRLIKENLSFEEVVEKIDNYVANTRLLFILEKVDNLVKNGRLSKLAGGVIGMLNIKLVGRASKEGTLELLHKARGTKKAIATLIDEMLKEGYKGGKVSIAHCNNVEVSETIKKILLEKFPNAIINYIPTQGLCSFYAERGGIMLGYEV
ncbi:DegV family protein [Gemelliphila palaticanis]|uniref:DegV family protein n=1 Tax=Gemelliphila palaticanis TaxID=81950 RepID=A0ABX2T2H4_9BACL|nr:DegV family protein [Gemella palaticanis]MBF0715903.1 DegV family protein [Gemella palaticanis]NYS47833.1 DegV family protein [Gemella palaticanis]